MGDRDKNLKELKEFKPGNPKVERVRILLHGPVGAGKSSLIKSINSIFQGEITNVALADSDIGGDSFTKTHKTYFIEDRSAGSKYAFAFNDTVGLEESGGVNKQDILLVLKGHVKDGYKFNSESPLSEDDPYYNNIPSLEDQVHCLVTVLATDTLSFMPKELIRKLRDIRLEASNMGIPQVVLLTRVDEACELVKKDVRNVYTSKYIKQQIEKCSALLGTPMNCILPVKNYHNEPELINDLDELLLKALKHIINFANDYTQFRQLPFRSQPKQHTYKSQSKLHFNLFLASVTDIKAL
ncbi:interferon-induced protein 44-like [Megalops cyprinoides]|uniref:interferon-induced protein 44-like n=1 Tax=Megalops cyprinoides TaxID=118141 RepID=UPI0018649ABB|nr:interferon-induced protein 44-like [Megalops cyprinoides]